MPTDISHLTVEENRQVIADYICTQILAIHEHVTENSAEISTLDHYVHVRHIHYLYVLLLTKFTDNIPDKVKQECLQNKEKLLKTIQRFNKTYNDLFE